ncbi:hypothetical protein AGRA3207_003971 [Actinomadura graeca]|uniref:Nuclear transport factor 2 family protein n=1 Tax=Actinomadura graeca TaxID=2750812 RepID=A0ABX8QXJ8_9ACTN|nr:hypothetical protein [Actinomadura graeca]QXJ22894.1 hypothetical protein AGRA3207_003971 [Actinomadura graeca]
MGTLGERFARALAAKDRHALRTLLGDPIDFKALTPGRHWDAESADEVVDGIVLGRWFEPDDHIERLLHVATDRVGDREHLSYRLEVRTGDGRHLVEQQVYYAVADDRIVWLRVLCSGFRPVPADVLRPS